MNVKLFLGTFLIGLSIGNAIQEIRIAKRKKKLNQLKIEEDQLKKLINDQEEIDSLTNGVETMALPLERVSTILEKAVQTMLDYNRELAICVDPKRRMEINREVELVRKIAIAAVHPYVDILKPYMEEDDLRFLGLI